MCSHSTKAQDKVREEKGKLVYCQEWGLSQQPPIFNSIANDICDQRARTPGGAYANSMVAGILPDDL